MEFLVDRSIAQSNSLADLERALEWLLNSGCQVWTEADGTTVLIETRALVERISGIKIEIYPNDHAPPHFHVKSADIDATFAISNGQLLRGRAKKKDQDLITWWYQRSKSKLVQVWNETRPTNCPVGPIKEPEA